VLKTAAAAFDRGWTGLKLYFMIGLPGETMDDIEDIIHLVNEVRAVGRKTKGKTPQIRIWVTQESEPGLSAKHELLKQGLQRKGIRLSWTDPEASLLEASLSRGDRRMGAVIYRAWQLGCTFDSWSEHFDFRKWQCAFQEASLEPGFYAHRERSLDELLPWAHIDVGVDIAFLKQEYQRSRLGQGTRDCRTAACNACGLERWQTGCQQKQRQAG